MPSCKTEFKVCAECQQCRVPQHDQDKNSQQRRKKVEVQVPYIHEVRVPRLLHIHEVRMPRLLHLNEARVTWLLHMNKVQVPLISTQVQNLGRPVEIHLCTTRGSSALRKWVQILKVKKKKRCVLVSTCSPVLRYRWSSVLQTDIICCCDLFGFFFMGFNFMSIFSPNN